MKTFILRPNPKAPPVRVKAKSDRLLKKRLGDVRLLLTIREDKN